VKIETRDELAAIWLPWYVWADGSGVVEALAAEIENARAVTLGEVALDPQHPVMRHVHPDSQFGPWTHAGRVEHYVEQLRTDAAIDLKAPAWETTEGMCSSMVVIEPARPTSWIRPAGASNSCPRLSTLGCRTPRPTFAGLHIASAPDWPNYWPNRYPRRVSLEAHRRGCT